MIIEQFGSQVASGDGYKVFEYKQKLGSISSFMVINEKESTQEVTLDLSQSEQCIYSTNQAINKRTLKSKQKRFYLHVQTQINGSITLKHSSKEPTKK